MSDFSQRLRSLSPEKKALLVREAKKKGNQFNFFPLSFAQQRLWLLDQLEPGNPSYNILTAIRFAGQLHVAALERSLHIIVQRHESLRTTFATLQGQLVQMVASSPKVSLPLIDLRGLSASEREPEVQRQADRESLHSFDLTKGPLLRIKLFRLSETEHVAVLNIHHIVSDGWSTAVLLRELAAIYSAILRGQPPSLPPLPIQYADYAAWQRKWLQGEILAEHLSYWRQRLAGAPPVLDLPTDRPRPAIQTYRGNIETLTLAPPLAQRLRDLSRGEGVTLFMTLLAIFQILLYRYSGQEDFVVGVPIANRHRPEIEGLIGFFVNSLALRAELSGNPSFHELLMRVREVALGAYAHQDLPFDKLVEEINPERNLSYTPLFQVYFNMINLPTYPTAWSGGLTVSMFAPHEAGSKFDLTLYATDGDEGILLELLYNTDLFDQARMGAMLRQFVHLASQVLDVEKKIAHFSLVTPTEHSILPNPTAPLPDRLVGSVQSLFAQQAQRTPGGLAVIDATGGISYQELDALSNRLAHYLCASGITRGDIVAIYAHRSLPLVLAMLGVLKAGAACLIIDPAYPPARLIEYLSAVNLRGWLHIQAAGLLPTELEEFLFTSACRCRLELPQRVSDLRAVLAAYSPQSADIEVGVDDLAFVTFTSGSTGQPKGVLQRHGPSTHFSLWQQQRFGLQEAERYSLLSGLAHDPLHREIFTPLCVGGTICIPPPEYIGSPGWLAEWMQRQAINTAHLTPAMLQLLTQSVSGASAPITLPGLRYAFTVGEVLTRRDVSRLYALAPSVTCVNLYGSTEAHRALGYFVIPRGESLAPSNAQSAKNTKEIIPLGQGIQDTQLLVLNNALQVAGISELGELYVRSPHLARGYLNDATLTQERFITNPFTGIANDRLYRTGDLGRYRPDGNVAYAGRNDQQVKLRGFRIELAEIETVLGLHPAVREAVVTVREDTPEQKRLVAYVVLTQTHSFASIGNELRDFLAKRLPAYMLPAVFVPLDSLPLAPSHKVDRRALPMPESALSTSELTVAPRTPTEEILAGIWARMLGRERVGVDDNFFDLGGHSLLATQLLARIYETFQHETPLRTLFETPTVAGLASYLEQHRPSDTSHKRQVIHPLSREQYRIENSPGHFADSSPDLSTISNAEYLFPLSFAQERLWFLDQFDSGNAYTIPVQLRIQGTLIVKALQQSIHALAQRHEILRTRFVTLQGHPRQAIASSLDIPLSVLDLSELPVDERQSQIQRCMQDEAQRSFDLAHDPLFSLTLLRLSPQEHLFLFSIHHSISDAWSIDVFFRELNVLYTSFSQGNPSALPKLPIQYADFAVWQRQWLQGEALARQLAYWKAQLANAPTVLELPTDHLRPALQSYRGARFPVVLPLSLAHGLMQLSRQHDVTLYMTLLAAFQILLFRYTGQQDLLVGTPIAGRTSVELEELIGLFINTLVMRGDLSGDPRFSELLTRVREVALDAYAHQDLPFEKLVEEVQPERNVSYSPLFQVMFILQNTPSQPLHLADLAVTPLQAVRLAAQYDLTLVLWQEEERLEGYLEYNTDLFAAATIERMVGHLRTLLEGIVTCPDQRIADLPLLPVSERQQMLVEWNATQAPYALTHSIQTLFEQQTARTPDAIAVVYANAALSYGELNRRANALAHYLRTQGAGPATLVAVCLERSLDLLVGLLAILKSGAAYVPLDPSYPQERLAFMLTDSQAPLVLTQQHLLSALPPTNIHHVCLDTQWSEIAREPEHNLPGANSGEELAYVIYTSGSTGQPKGVQITHRALLNFLAAMRTQPGLHPQDRVLAVTSLSFDIAGLELYLPLLVGGQILLASQQDARDGQRLAALLTSGAATLMQATPATWRLLLEAGWPGNAHLRILCCGEAFPPDLARQLLTRGAALWNLYGPTETTIWSLSQQVQAVGRTIPIGRPLANTQVYVLDARWQPVPIGVAGDLYLGGAGLARGYLHRPELTAERFVPHPFSSEPGQRLYRTGDVARYREDGVLEFLGRDDQQIKLRGYRIELGEIEAALAQHPTVRQSVVALREDSHGDPRLVAYVVAHDEHEALVMSDLRRFLAGKLPEYMLPSAIVCLPALPLTPNGKVDRNTLPAPEHVLPELAGATPRTPMEELLAQIWGQVLRLEYVGLYDNFFELGGHSLLATQLLARIRGTFQVEISLRSLFMLPTVASLAPELEAARTAQLQNKIPPLTPAMRDKHLPLSFAQQRLWFLDQWESGSPFYNIPLALRVTGNLDVAALECSFTEIVRRHEGLRTTFVMYAEHPLQTIHSPFSVLLPLVDLQGIVAPPYGNDMTRMQDWLVSYLTQTHAQQSFDLSWGPLFKVLLLRLGSTEHILLLTLHHIISDAWSVEVLLHELDLLYAAFVAGHPSPLPALPIQYADYAIWQRQWLQGEALAQQLAYWKAQLAHAPAVLELPTDHPRPALQSYRGARLPIVLPPSLTHALTQLSRQHDVTLYMTLLAAFQVLLFRYSGQHDILVGTPIAGRTSVEVEGLIGLFINTLILRGDLRGDPRFSELLRRVREVALDTYAQQDLPFEKLVEELQPERSVSYSPLFQVMFILQNTPSQPLHLADLTLTPLQTAWLTAKFDLTLMLWQDNGMLQGYLEYNTDLFAASTIARMAWHLHTLLEGIIAEPTQRLSQLPLLSAAERQQLLVDWNATQAPYAHDSSLHHLFEAQVEGAPEAIAVSFEEAHLSYGELNRRANALAHSLRKQGAGPATLVAVCLERSLELLVGLLGILKSGAAYVPLDPSYPKERLAFMLSDSQASLLLTQQQLLDAVPATSTPIVLLDAQWPEMAQELEDNPAHTVRGEELAYVIYTSGSTGQPKGVQISHRALLNFLTAMRTQPGLHSQDRVLALTSLSFDIAGLELYLPLLVGAQVLLASQQEARDGQRLAQLLTHGVATLMQATPATWRLLLEAGWPGEPHLRMLCGGEAFPPELARQLLSRGAELWNLYGPTETTIWSLTQSVQSVEGRSIPIGRPIANTQVYVLDARWQPVPIGVAGDLYLGGAGLARGYLHRPDLTAARFVPDPFSPEPGQRLYSTGDRARWLPGGVLEFLGRTDQQIKLRGFRIELGEIEAALAQHPAVRQSVVALRADEQGEPRLVAYVVAHEGHQGQEALALGSLRRFLAGKLPEYMLPSAVVELSALPLTPNGKVDRNTLPAPEHVLPELAGATPRTPMEELLAQIWGQVLGLERVGLYDNFFELGGHSLLATQLLAHIRGTFQVELPLRSLFMLPTVAGLAPELEAARTAHLQNKIPPLTPGMRDEHLPLSFAQQRLWFLDQWESGSPVYNIPLALRVTGNLNVAALERSFTELVRRHEVLRTTFVAQDGQPLQIIHSPFPMLLPVIDLQELASSRAAMNMAETREELVHQLSETNAQQSFDLSQGPLFNVVVLRLESTEHVLLLTLHHIISDAWSVDVLLHELDLLYAAFVSGHPSPLPTLPIQYADYAIWQRQWLQGETLAQQLAYWKAQLADAPAMLELPTDRARPALQSYRGARLPVVLPRSLAHALAQLSRQHDVTLYMTLLAAFQTLLFRYTGQQDLLVGTPIAGRTSVELEGLIGLFINTLVLRGDLRGDPRFSELLGRVREVALDAYAQQDLPFEKLVEELQPERSVSYSPLFQVMFILQNTPSQPLQLAELVVTPLEAVRVAARYDLTLVLWQEDERLEGYLEYNTDLFAAPTIARMAGNLRTLLEGIVTRPDQRIANLSLLPVSERQQLLVDWNATQAPYAHDSSLHHLFEAQVEGAPEAIAVSFEEAHLSYGELNRRANALAHFLRKQGAGPATLVAVCLERSLELLVGLLGILKSGAAYVPLDPSYPKERLAFMLSDSQAPLVLTQQRLLSALPPTDIQRVCLDTQWSEMACEPEQNPVHANSGEELAYVIYTSGSTGQPKGVQISHRALLNFLTAMRTQPGLHSQDRVLALTSLSFDIAGLELYLPLLVGAQVLLASQQEARDGQRLAQLLTHGVATLMQATPATWRLLLEAGWPGEPHLRMLCGGEAFPPELARQLLSRGAELWNLYGPTETTIWSLTQSVQSAAVGRSIPIGRPIANTQVYVLDARWQPVPIGVAGDLYLGGAGLARGYLHRPDLTAARFVPDPFSPEPGQRLYSTGDRARWLPGGVLEFLGRTDQQIKLRGYRIELGEIEVALAQHPAVRQSVVALRADEQGEPRLVAYVVAHEGHQGHEALTLGSLRRFLAGKLPEYMLPSAMVELSALPLTPNGKVDRNALPAPERFAAERQDSRKALWTPTEELLADIWAQVLHVDQIGLNDNFFAIGGHSLLATQIAARARNLFGVDLPLRAIFELPTVAALAEKIDLARHNRQPLQILPLIPAIRDEHLPLSFAQQRLWFLDQLETGSPVYNIPLALHVTGNLNVAALERSFTELVRRHEVLRTTFVVHAEHPLQIIHPPFSVPLPLVDLQGIADLGYGNDMTRMQDKLVSHLAQTNFQQSFALSRGPLFKVLVLRLESTEHVLLLTLHHIISDAWSVEVLLHELDLLYAAFVAGHPSPLPTLPIQYADYAIWQRQWLQGEALAQQLAYWKAQLAHAPAVLELPTDHARPHIQTYRGARYPLQLSPALSRELDLLSSTQGVTLYMTLLAAFQTLLFRYTGQQDLLVGTPIAGRTSVDLEGLIGLFINTLILRGDLRGDPRFSELLRRVREVALDTYAQQDLPFEKLVEELQPERSVSYSPLFQVMFILQNTPSQPLHLADLTLTPLQTAWLTAKFDLTLMLWQDNGMLQGYLEYNTDLFAASTIARMAWHLHTLLEGIIAEPTQRLSQLPLLSAAERQQLLVDWNATQAPYAHDSSLHHLFEAQVEGAPEAIAVSFEEAHLSYGELNRRANALAHSLRKQGAGPATLVAVCLERSLELLVGLLGILKSGAAYVPLDPSYPKERLAFMLSDSQASLLLTQQQLLDAVPATSTPIVLLDAQWPEMAQELEDNPAHTVRGEELAYVIYTSGSTGQPKGVQISHRALLNFLTAMRTQPGLHSQDRVLALTSLSFDIAGLELYLPLLVGAQVLLASQQEARDGQRLAQLLTHGVATLMQATPATWRLLLEAGWPGEPHLRMLCGGEAFPPELARQLLSRGAELWNLYGPTETTIWSLTQSVQSAVGRSIPIGRPIANTQVYVLDARWQPVPIGVAGDLYLGGAGLARGYLHRPDLTAARFVPDPFSPEPGQRLYSTGDRARWLPGGVLEFLGRTDQQIKLRGYRIELGEIEVALAQHPAVRQSIVALRADEQGEPRLVAYIVAREETVLAHEGHEGLAMGSLRRFLAGKLPEYMLPSAVVLLPALPLTPNGKIDRQALPAPQQAIADMPESTTRPPTPVEEVLMDVWAEVLGRERVEVFDNFFELGGHSLLATQVIARVRTLFQVDLSVLVLFESPTIASFAESLIEDEPVPGQITAMANVRLKLKRMSPQEVRQRLIQSKKTRGD